VPTFLKSWSFNLLEPAEPVQACTGILSMIIVQPSVIFLGLYITVKYKKKKKKLACSIYDSTNA
jgi:hypothetical protein